MALKRCAVWNKTIRIINKKYKIIAIGMIPISFNIVINLFNNRSAMITISNIFCL